MKKLLLLLLMAGSAFGATTYSEFYCRSGGDNLNSGSTTNVAAIYTGVGDSDGTSVFTPSDGSTPASTVTNGAFGSVYVTSGATVSTFVGLVTNVAAGVNGAVTFSQVAKTGAFPGSSGGAHTITLKVGGAWKGPNGAVGFPWRFVNSQLTNDPTIYPCVNFMNDATYVVTSPMIEDSNGPIRFQGYSTVPHDGGKAWFDHSAAGSSISLMALNGGNLDVLDMIFSDTGATSGSSVTLSTIGVESTLTRVVVHDARNAGFSASGPCVLIECEAYSCNKANQAQVAGISLINSSATAIRCISHDNTTANASGFKVDTSTSCFNCIADSNGTNGFYVTSTALSILENCDSYNNGGHGIELSSASTSGVLIENCNLVKNTHWGITSGSTLRNGRISNCAFGAGTQANGDGTINTGLGGINVFGTLTYANDVTPWVDPANGDFRINLTAAKSAGRGVFTETATSYAGTVAYPDIGAAQSSSTNSTGGGTVGYGFAQ